MAIPPYMLPPGWASVMVQQQQMHAAAVHAQMQAAQQQQLQQQQQQQHVLPFPTQPKLPEALSEEKLQEKGND